MPSSLPRTPRGRRRRRARFRARPFFVSIAVVLSLVAVSYIVPGILGPRPAVDLSSPVLGKRAALLPVPDDGIDLECRLVHQYDDKCAFVRANCQDEEAGLLPYLTFYYCSGLRHVQPLAFTVLVFWLGLLFTTIGIAASDFFSVNLGTIASILGLSESLAGVTFLAFGNGSPDVFSTFAAMGSNSGSMAVGELIGAAGFITAVVAGSMALVREFRVSKRTFVRDILFFIVSVLFAMVFLADGCLLLWECIAMIGFYVFYVITVVGWHWVSQARKRRRQREAASRAHFYSSADAAHLSGNDELAPYRDDVGGGAPTAEGGDADADVGGGGGDGMVGGRRSRPPPDISALERGPRIEIDSVESPGLHINTDINPVSSGSAPATSSPSTHPPPLHPHLRPYANHSHLRDDDDDDDEEAQERRSRHITAEMTSSMRVGRPRRRRGTTTITPIRPSLLGALEFRSVLASLQRSGTMHLAPLDTRRAAERGHNHHHRPSLPSSSRNYSAQNLRDGSQSAILAPQRIPPYFDEGDEASHSNTASFGPTLGVPSSVGSRGRALSSGDLPRQALLDQHVYSNNGGNQLAIPSVIPSAVPSGTASPLIDSLGATPASTVPPSEIGDFHFSPGSSQAPSRTGSGLLGEAERSLGGGAASAAVPIPGATPSNEPSPRISPALSPFPGYSEPSPRSGSPLPPQAGQPPSRISSFGLPPPELDHHISAGSGFRDLDDDERAALPKPVRWWPYGTLPPPHVIMCTLFPTLQGWREKSIWDKFVSLISTPTVFLLVTTLPVVEMEAQDDDNDDDDDDYGGFIDEEEEGQIRLGDDDNDVPGNRPPTPLISAPEGTGGSLGRHGETEWQRYRRVSNAGLNASGSPSGNTLRASRGSRSSGAAFPAFRDEVDLEADSASTAVSIHSATASGDENDDGDANANGHGHGNGHVVEAIIDGLSAASIRPPVKATPEGPDELAIPVTISGAEDIPAAEAVGRPPTSATSEVDTVAAAAAAAVDGWNRWLVALQLFTGPFFTVFILWANMAEDMEHPGRTLAKMLLYSLVASLAMLGVLLATTTPDRRPKYHSLLCFLGFVIAVAWISTVAGEVVGVLKAIGVIVGISEAILGLTIFAVGNSLGDLVADITVARLGFPVMALSACFGGPMLNILLGVGIGGAWMTIKAAKDHERRHPDQPRHYEPYNLQVGGTLLVSAVTVLVTLVVLLIAVPYNRWIMSRKIGLVLIAIWTVSTVINVVLEVLGTMG